MIEFNLQLKILHGPKAQARACLGSIAKCGRLRQLRQRKRAQLTAHRHRLGHNSSQAFIRFGLKVLEDSAGSELGGS